MIMQDAGGGVVTSVGRSYLVSAIESSDKVAGIESISRSSGIDGMDVLRNGNVLGDTSIMNPASIGARFHDQVLESGLIEEIDDFLDRVGLPEQCLIFQ